MGMELLSKFNGMMVVKSNSAPVLYRIAPGRLNVSLDLLGKLRGKSTSCGNKLVGVHNRMGIKFASKFNGTLVAKSLLFKLVKVSSQHWCPGAACCQKPTRSLLISLPSSGEGDSRLFEPMCLSFLD
eukprot:1154674-Pelagomonas_calceolata.AAC.4